MRERELRLALVCYGGISLAVYMHGITKEVWHLARASRAAADDAPRDGTTADGYRAMLSLIGDAEQVRLRVVADIIAGASAGGINGIFLAQAIATGQSLEPLTDLWLDNADVDALLDPDARPLSRFSKWWAVPIAWMAMRRRGNAIDRTVGGGAQDEVRAKLSRFVRARWFAPPFGGRTFTAMLLDAFAAMRTGPIGPPLVPDGYPVDLMVTVTDYAGHAEPLRINSPAMVTETEHRLTMTFRRDAQQSGALADEEALTIAARATASFPGAFPPFTLREIDAVLASRGQYWPGREAFIASHLPARSEADRAVADRPLIDGSVLANAPFAQAIAALRQRPARREVDRRFVFIDPKPDFRAITLGTTRSGGKAPMPGFFTTILGAMSDIPREQPIRDNIEAINRLSDRIARMRRIMTAMEPEVDAEVERVFGRTFFLDSPTPSRLASWRAKAHAAVADRSGFAYAGYGAVKLEAVLDEQSMLLARLGDPAVGAAATDARRDHIRYALRTAVEASGVARAAVGGDAAEGGAVAAFFRTHDLGFRVRRLRLLARRLDTVVEAVAAPGDPALQGMHKAIFTGLGLYLERQSDEFYGDWRPIPVGDAALEPLDAAILLRELGARRDFMAADMAVDAMLATALSALPRDQRRAMLLSYLGFPFTDLATLPLLQGQAVEEFDPIKIDRISPPDATTIRSGGTAATLKGIEFNSFGAFFSRAYRENDYLWGRLHGADRLIDIVASTQRTAEPIDEARIAAIKRTVFRTILRDERPRLTSIPTLFDMLDKEIEH